MTKYDEQIDLTLTEQIVLRMIVGRMSDKEIGFALDLSETDIKSTFESLFRRMGVSDTNEAAALAVKRGLVRIDL